MGRIFRIAGIAAIVSGVLFLAILWLAILRAFEDSGYLRYATLALLMISLPISVMVLIGYLLLSEAVKSPVLTRLCWIMIFITLAGALIDAMDLFIDKDATTYVSYALTIVSGIVFLSFGWAVLQVKDFYPLTKTLGVVYMVQGAALISVLLIIVVAPFTAVLTSILEALLFFEASRRYAHEKTKVHKVRKRTA
jgi:hypothetical protein